MSVEKKKSPVILCVNSVKGGAGKTTFSLSCLVTVLKQIKARNTEKKPPNTEQHSLDSDTSKPTARVCYVDADLLGTGARHIIYNDDNVRNFFNEETNDFASVINEIKLNELTDDHYKMHCVLLSDNPMNKDRYINDPRQGCTARVKTDLFLCKFNGMIDYLIDNGNYDFIVIDGSPGYDDIPRGIYHYLVDRHNDIRVINIVVTTTEQSHVKCTLQLIAKDSGLSQDTGKMRIVVNDITGIFSGIHIEGIDKESFKNAIKNNYAAIINCKSSEIPIKTSTGASLAISKEQIEDIYIHDYTKFSNSMVYSRMNRLDNSKIWEELINLENEICKLALDS